MKKENILIVTPTFEQAVDLIEQRGELATYNKCISQIITDNFVYTIFDSHRLANSEQLMGLNIVNCFVIDEATMHHKERYYTLMCIANQRRLHMNISTTQFFKYFNGGER